jgi:hypothetical protein
MSFLYARFRNKKLFKGWSCYHNVQPPSWSISGLHLVLLLPFDPSGLGDPARSLLSRQHSSRDHHSSQASPPVMVVVRWEAFEHLGFLNAGANSLVHYQVMTHSHMVINVLNLSCFFETFSSNVLRKLFPVFQIQFLRAGEFTKSNSWMVSVSFPF